MRHPLRKAKLIVIVFLLVITMQHLTACTNHPVKVAVIARLESGSIMGMSTWDQVKFYQSRHPDQSNLMEFVPYNDDGTWEGIKQYILDTGRFETELSTVEIDAYGDATGTFYVIESILEEFE